MKTLQLDSGASSLVLSVQGDRLCMLHLGSKLGYGPGVGADSDALAAITAPVLPHGELDRDPLTLAFPGHDGRPQLMPALELRRSNRRLLTELRVTSTALDASGLLVQLDDHQSGVSVNYRVEADNHNAFTFGVTLVNKGEDPLAVDWLASAHIPLASQLVLIQSHGGYWANEFQPRESSVAEHLQSWVSDRGRSSHGSSASLVLGEQNLSDEHGAALQAGLLWPGNHRLSVGPLPEGGYGLQGGVLLEPGELVLAPGESYEAPGLVVTASDTGRNGLRASMARFWSQRTPHTRSPDQPVHFNSWEGCYFDHDEVKILSLIGKAQELGAERFVLDDGWMENRTGPGLGLGDWRPCPRRYPRGLGPVAHAVREAGMEFGLWVEPESVTPDSRLAREHPEWIVQIHDRNPIAGRSQFLLDISRAAVRSHILQWLDRLIDETTASYLKWDMNRDYAQVGYESSTRSLAMTEGFLALVEQFRRRHPKVALELCGAGGARSDAGTMVHADRLWPTDSLDPLQRWQVVRHSSVLLPPTRLGWHMGGAPAETSGAVLPLNTRCILTLLGHAGIELDPAKLSTSDEETVRHWINVFKVERHWLAHAEWHYLDTQPGEAEALLVKAANGEQAFLFLLQSSYPRRGHPGMLRLPLSLEGQSYRAAALNSDDHAFAQTLPQWLENSPVSIPGEMLNRVGLRPPPLRYGHCALIRFKVSN